MRLKRQRQLVYIMVSLFTIGIYGYFIIKNDVIKQRGWITLPYSGISMPNDVLIFCSTILLPILTCQLATLVMNQYLRYKNN